MPSNTVSCGPWRLTRMAVFFFSSRRRHTRWTGDWSSDVCSSDLGQSEQALGKRVALVTAHRGLLVEDRAQELFHHGVAPRHHLDPGQRVEFIRGEAAATVRQGFAHARKIGRASCRERVYTAGCAG